MQDATPWPAQPWPGAGGRRQRPLGKWWWQDADAYGAKLIELYCEERGRRIQYVKAFELCEHGVPVAVSDGPKLFAFSPS